MLTFCLPLLSIMHIHVFQTKTTMTNKLSEYVKLLLTAWQVSGNLQDASEGDETSAPGHLAVHMRARTKKALERLHKTNIVDVLEGCVEAWLQEERARPVSATSRWSALSSFRRCS